MRFRPSSAAAAGAALALVLTGCSTGDDAPTAAPLAPVAGDDVTQEPSEAPASEEPSPSKSAVASASASTMPTRVAPPSYDVKAVQTRLTALNYYIGAVDGERGGQLRSAVMAFQKVNGLSADGSVGKATLAALKAPKTPVLRGSGSGTRVEADLTKQVIYIVKNGKIMRILPTSSGNGERYLTKNGNVARALSPVGYYKIQRRIVGERRADLGVLYDPQYFYKGWAIHGSNSVPAFPASHGCLRVTRSDAKYLLNVLSNGVNLYIYGGRHVFTAGSSAPGTDDPGGDVPVAPAKPSPSPVKTTSSPKPSASPSASASPKPSASASASPSPSATP